MKKHPISKLSKENEDGSSLKSNQNQLPEVQRYIKSKIEVSTFKFLQSD